jgi:hypothetical protein
MAINKRQRYYLHLIRTANSAVHEISQVLLIIANKRLTLAEQAIMSELRACLYWEGRLIAALAKLLQEEIDPYIINGKMLRQINGRLVEKLQGFSKAANHNLNYLEQYFEHDFWLELSQDKTALRLSQIIAALQDKDLSRLNF